MERKQHEIYSLDQINFVIRKFIVLIQGKSYLGKTLNFYFLRKSDLLYQGQNNPRIWHFELPYNYINFMRLKNWDTISLVFFLKLNCTDLFRFLFSYIIAQYIYTWTYSHRKYMSYICMHFSLKRSPLKDHPPRFICAKKK